ncbi:hypothetical protein ABT160_25630 [Streptomyces sp. NPDC001941]|uniref:hypothetical protein n=1 Tax=Streptomyces sp. NPDC001941 TaxID=3154659 RepID=UPI003317809C
MTPAPAPPVDRVPRLVWTAVAFLSALLVVTVAGWQAWGTATVRGGVLDGGSGGRPVTALEIVAGDADVTVTPRADREVGYRAETSWSQEEPSVEETWLGDTLRLTPHCPDEDGWASVAPGAGCAVRLAVTVPVDLPVKLTAASGRTAISGLGGNVQVEIDSGQLALTALRGTLRATVGSGRLAATGLTSAQADLTVGSGRAVADFVVPPDRLTARIGSGRAALTVPAATRLRLDCTAGKGRCEVPEGLDDPGSRRTLDLTVDSGRADVGYPAAW